MKEINKFIEQLIPPSDYSHRNGFSNEKMLLDLAPEEKLEIENILLEMLPETEDHLIGESLTILRSKRSIKNLLEKVRLSKAPISKITWASFVNKITGGDEVMKSIALEEFHKVTDKWNLISAFHILSTFNDSVINEKIRSFINHKDYLIAYNARTSLGINTKEIVDRERKRSKDKRWWQVWK